MYDNYNYPCGADTPDAPWNQEKLEPIETEVCVSYSMSKSMIIPIANYIAEEWEDSEYDEDGHLCRYGGESYDFSDTDFEEEFNNSNELGIPALLDVLKGIAVDKITEATINNNKRELNKWNRIKEACESWEVDEFVVTEG